MIRYAVRVHADIIYVHPFEDGNGRTSRLIANHILVRFGLRPVSFDVVKQDYTETLNHYYRNGDIEPLVDLCIALYRV